jgi:hypothetical protein
MPLRALYTRIHSAAREGLRETMARTPCIGTGG